VASSFAGTRSGRAQSRHEVGEVVAAIDRVAHEAGLGEDRRVEAGRVALGGGDGLGLVVEAQAGLEAERVGVGGEVVAGAQEQLTPGEALVMLVGVAVAALPVAEDRVDVGELAAVLQVDAAPVVVLHGAGQEPGEGGAAVVGEREGFELLEIHARPTICRGRGGRLGALVDRGVTRSRARGRGRSGQGHAGAGASQKM
jgi:hypothetical protein